MVKKIAAIVCFVAGIGTIIWMQAKPQANSKGTTKHNSFDFKQQLGRGTSDTSRKKTDSVKFRMSSSKSRVVDYEFTPIIFSDLTLDLPDSIIQPLQADSTNNDTTR